jgi:8-oxo-dGTP pyrophosphatase MutT (NUDIX family)
MKTRLEISAGGVIYRHDPPSEPEVCLISTQGRTAWQLPKGIIEDKELPEEAAAREVAEETGLTGELEKPLGRIEYWYVWEDETGKTRVHKYVDFYLFRFVSGLTDDHDDEVDEARWFSLTEALKRISYDGERSTLELAAKSIAS